MNKNKIITPFEVYNYLVNTKAGFWEVFKTLLAYFYGCLYIPLLVFYTIVKYPLAAFWEHGFERMASAFTPSGVSGAVSHTIDFWNEIMYFPITWPYKLGTALFGSHFDAAAATLITLVLALAVVGVLLKILMGCLKWWGGVVARAK